jgi:hypothetical protein
MDAELYGNPSAIFKRIQFCHDLNFECAIPAMIKAVYADHTADALPLMNIMSSTAEINRAVIRVTTLWNFHGGFEVWQPLNIGDTGWLIAADRNTDLIKQYNCGDDETKNMGPQNANNDKNLHKYRWGFFIPDRWDVQDRQKREVPKSLQHCFYVQSRNGESKCLLDDEGHIAITAKLATNIFGELFVNDKATFKDDVHFEKNITVDGQTLLNELEVLDKAKFRKDVTFDESIYVNGNQSRVNDMVEQELVCVTGVEKDETTKRTILKLEKMRVLRSAKTLDKEEPVLSDISFNSDVKVNNKKEGRVITEKGKDIDILTGGGGGGCSCSAEITVVSSIEGLTLTPQGDGTFTASIAYKTNKLTVNGYEETQNTKADKIISLSLSDASYDGDLMVTTRYDNSSHNLYRTLIPVVIKNGIVVSVGEKTEEAYTTAVEES